MCSNHLSVLDTGLRSVPCDPPIICGRVHCRQGCIEMLEHSDSKQVDGLNKACEINGSSQRSLLGYADILGVNVAVMVTAGTCVRAFTRPTC